MRQGVGDDGYLGYDPRLSFQRFGSFVDSESLKNFVTDFPIFHGSIVDDVFATQSMLEAFSAPLIYTESNSQGFDGGFGGSDNSIFPHPSKMLPRGGLSDEFKVGFYQKRKITIENNKATKREREKQFLANHEKFHVEVDKNYWKAITDSSPMSIIHLPHLKHSPPAPAPTKDAKLSTSAPPKAAVVAVTPKVVVVTS
ncbi:clathrin light chain 2-like [Pyrus ussuriensis x Pyrus communis]|uniref:Clathrin light chain 2-like n=1 Tax=Pyrus ussuriensis x Pyrus communis TaxID=2448454 RepID=A0A5N5FS19_9ROSA|nr:clathrin light chain 2-like [Pyrus ussuriensis x Pyrus communis]